MTIAIETVGLGKKYGKQWALRDCTLAVPAGKVAALVGANGAGKSTLLHLLVGLMKPTEGQVRILGETPDIDRAAVQSRIGFVAQDRPLYRGFTVGEMLEFGKRFNPQWDDHLARHRMSQLGLPLAGKVKNLSGGQQAQVSLVMALANRPDLLLLDEPIASLDPLARREFLQVLMESVATDGLTVLV